MPLLVDKLTNQSNDKEIRDAIAESMSTCMGETPPAGTTDQQKYCAGKLYGIARQKTGKSLGAEQ